MRVSRREFIKAVTGMAGILGLEASGILKLQEVIAAKGAPSVIWLQGQSCTGCSVSFLNSIHFASVDDLLLNSINLEYHSNVMAAVGDFAISAASISRPSLGEIEGLNAEWGKQGQTFASDLNGDGTVNMIDYALMRQRGYILIVEGSTPTGADGDYCRIGNGLNMIDALEVYGKNASQIISIGTCASYGGMYAADPNPTNALSTSDALKTLGVNKSVVNIPGCPIHPDWLVGTIIDLLVGNNIDLDEDGRPTRFFGEKIHDEGNCPFKKDPKIHKLGMKGCLKDIGCRGPQTHSDCFSRQWNSPAKGQDGVNWCIGAGSPCIGCTEPKFPDGMSPFYNIGELMILKAEYKILDQELRVEAASAHQPDDTLTLQGYGNMTLKGDKYEYRVRPVASPDNSITVTSSISGKSVTKAVEFKEG
jgi:hydrogenase small subunit